MEESTVKLAKSLECAFPNQEVIVQMSRWSHFFYCKGRREFAAFFRTKRRVPIFFQYTSLVFWSIFNSFGRESFLFISKDFSFFALWFFFPEIFISPVSLRFLGIFSHEI